MMACFKVKRHDRDEIKDAEKYFIKNGGVFLEELIALCNGRSNIPIPHISANELLRATNNYDQCQICASGYDYQLYKGYLKDRPIFVKRYDKYRLREDFPVMPYKDIAIGSQMSIHKNVLKVIGYCLETKTPTIVYEFVGTKILSKCIFSSTDVQPLPWKCRLKIAVDISNVIAYLHTAFARPVIHRDIKSSNIILDENNLPKLFHFGLCIAIPEGQSHIEDSVRGRVEFMAPEYYATGYLTEKADVYSFGLLLLELLSGQRQPDYLHKCDLWNNYFNHNVEELSSIVDSSITHEGIEVEQLLNFATVVDRCIAKDEELRPTMTDVGKELRQIYQTFPSPY